GRGAPQVAQKLLPGVLIRPQLEQFKIPPAIPSSLRTALPGPGAAATGAGAGATGGGTLAGTGAGGRAGTGAGALIGFACMGGGMGAGDGTGCCAPALWSCDLHCWQ